MTRQIRKRIAFSDAPRELAQQVGDLSLAVLDLFRSSVALDGTNGPLVAALDCGAMDVVNARTVTYGDEPEEADVSTGGLLVIDWQAAQAYSVTLSQNVVAVQFTDPPGVGEFHLIVRQDATGGRTVAGWENAIKWPNATPPVVTATASKRDVFSFLYDGRRYYGQTVGQEYGS